MIRPPLNPDRPLILAALIPPPHPSALDPAAWDLTRQRVLAWVAAGLAVITQPNGVPLDLATIAAWPTREAMTGLTLEVYDRALADTIRDPRT